MDEKKYQRQIQKRHETLKDWSDPDADDAAPIQGVHNVEEMFLKQHDDD